MSIKKTPNTPASNSKQTIGGVQKKQGGMGMMIGIAVCVLVGIISIVTIFTGGGGKKEPQKKNEKVMTTQDAVTGTKAPRVYENTHSQGSQNPKTAPTQHAGISGSDYVESTSNGLVSTYTDPVTNVEMVHTPNGPIPVDSVDGRRFIEETKQRISNQGQPSQSALSVNTQTEIDNLKKSTNEQVQALDEKINELSGQVDTLVALNKKQTETIVALSAQLKSVQPVVKSTGELAKELFGKGGERVLASKNRAVEADSIVGDKAYFTNKEGLVVLVGVGDVVPGTSLIVKKIDASTNKVIVAD